LKKNWHVEKLPERNRRCVRKKEIKKKGDFCKKNHFHWQNATSLPLAIGEMAGRSVSAR
jgi:hypothetical protein